MCSEWIINARLAVEIICTITVLDGMCPRFALLPDPIQRNAASSLIGVFLYSVPHSPCHHTTTAVRPMEQKCSSDVTWWHSRHVPICFCVVFELAFPHPTHQSQLLAAVWVEHNYTHKRSFQSTMLKRILVLCVAHTNTRVMCNDVDDFVCTWQIRKKDSVRTIFISLAVLRLGLLLHHFPRYFLPLWLCPSFSSRCS